MGLFDPPYKNMLKKVPVHARTEADIIETYVESQMGGWDKHTVNHAKGVIVSVWACNAAMNGKFELRDSDWRLIQNLGGTSFNLLTHPAQGQVQSMLDHLKERGLI